MDIDQTVHIYVIQNLKISFLWLSFCYNHRSSNLAINVFRTLYAALCIRNIRYMSEVEEL